jgi:hypothetical protein
MEEEKEEFTRKDSEEGRGVYKGLGLPRVENTR